MIESIIALLIDTSNQLKKKTIDKHRINVYLDCAVASLKEYSKGKEELQKDIENLIKKMKNAK